MVVSTRVLKEPKGFIRIIQCIMAILAFSTTAGFSTNYSFVHMCGNKHNDTETFVIEYPFSFREGKLIEVTKDCDSTNGNGYSEANANGDVPPVRLPFDFSSSAEFFVATGVLSFLYTIAIIIVYIFLHQQYANDPKLPVVDLAVTSILAVFWLAGSSAWAQGVVDLKYYMEPDNLFGIIQVCGMSCAEGVKNCCGVITTGNYATLNVSLVFGFACFLLWASSLWFVFKETIFHTPIQAAPDATQNQTIKSPSAV